MRRAIVTTLVLASAAVAAACGGGDDDAADGDASAPAATVAATAAEAADEQAADSDGGGQTENANAGGGNLGEHGGISFTMSGGHETSGEWSFVPEASSFDSGWWSMSFTDSSMIGGTILALSLDPNNLNFSYGDGDATVLGMPPDCTITVDRQDSAGASGSIECSNLTALTATDSLGGVNFSANFDATTGSGGGAVAAPEEAAAGEQPAAVTASTAASVASSGAGNATVTMTGGHDANASWVFAPDFSMFTGTWTMTFQDPTNPMTAGGPFLTLLVVPDAPSLTFSDGLVTIVDSNGKCNLQLDRQDDSGAAGTMSCTGVEAIGATAPVDITATFDGTV
jgi:hypothetical protein